MREQLQPFLDYLRLNRNLSRHTVRAYGSDLSQFFEFAAALLGHEPRVEDFDHRLVRDYLAETYERRQASSSSARKLAAVRTFARYLRREGLLEHDPGTLVSAPKVERRMPPHMAVDEMGALLAAPDAATPLGLRDRAILELFYASGLRLSELVRLDLEDINLSSRHRPRARQGRTRSASCHSIRSTAAAVREYVSGAIATLMRAAVSRTRRPPRARGTTPNEARRCSSTIKRRASLEPAASIVMVRRCVTHVGDAARGWASARTPCGTRSRRTCLSAGADLRDDSGVARACPRDAPPSATRTSAPRS